MRKLTLIALGLVLLGAGCTSSETTATVTMREPASATSSTKTSTTEPMDDQKTLTAPGILPGDQIEGKQVRITTEKGEIVIQFYPDTAPLAVSNFIYLADQGFYDGVIFHRIIAGFMAQGGDPLGKGYGGPGYKFADELDDDRTYDRGTVAMANAGPNTNGSQFFIMFVDGYPLPHDYTIFGHVTEGMDVVDSLKIGDAMTKVVVEDVK